MKPKYAINRVEEIKKDLKKLEKKFDTIRDDLKIFEKALLVSPQKLPGIVRAKYREVKIKPEVEVYKAKKFYCKSLKGKGARSGIRVLYGFWSSSNSITISEIYYKERESTECDLDRLKEYFGI